MAKTHQRLDYTRLAEALGERGLVDHAALEDALQQCVSTGTPLTKLLVEDSLASDWELSRIACEIFNLPFLTLDICPPNDAALKGIDPAFLRRYLLVPLERFGDVLTVAMPALVPTEVLTALGRLAEAHVLPVVSTVSSNKRWLDEHIPAPQGEEVPAPLPMMQASAVEDDAWASLFDEADAAVQLDLTGVEEEEVGGADLEL
jgi:hypothetical protein